MSTWGQTLSTLLLKTIAVHGSRLAACVLAMIWFFELRGRFRRCEVHPVDATHYRFTVRDSDGSERIEDYSSYEDLLSRTRQLETEWHRHGWTGPHSRDIR